MNHRILNTLFGVCLMVPVASAGVFAFASPVGAHIEVSHKEDCTGISLGLSLFPEGSNDITLTGESSVIKQLIGPSGTVTATWLELGYDQDTPGAYWSYTATWFAHGESGTAGPYGFNVKFCEPPTTTTTPAPPTTVTVPTITPAPPAPNTTVQVVTPATLPTPPVEISTTELARTGPRETQGIAVGGIVLVLVGAMTIRRSNTVKRKNLQKVRIQSK